MASGRPRITRLSAITTLLQSKKLITAHQIAEQFDISIRTVYRDIRTLIDSGIPVVTIEGRGYQMMDGYTLPPISFTEEEALAITTADLIIAHNSDQSLSKAYKSAALKISAVLKERQKSNTELLSSRIQIRTSDHSMNASDILIKVQQYLANSEVINIIYLSLDHKITERRIEPFAIYTTKGNWILIAFCREKKDFRAFRLDRIQRILPTGENFTPHDMTLEQYLETCRKKWSTPDTPLSYDPSTFAANKSNNTMKHVKLEAFNIIGISIMTTNADGQAARDIQELWQQFLVGGTSQKIPNKVEDTVYSLYTDYEGDHNKPYRCIIGCKVTSLDTIPEGMIGKKIDGATYAMSSTRGNLQEGIVVKEWQRIWSLPLNRTYRADFEIFGEKAMNPADAEVDFYVGVI